MFIDTTSTFIWRAEETALRPRGYSRDRRPDQPQVIICLAVDRHGWPIAWDILPGNTDDRTAFTQMIETLRTRFHIGRVIAVADRGMVSQKVLDLLTGDPRAPFDYILGCRLRQDKVVTDDVLARRDGTTRSAAKPRCRSRRSTSGTSGTSFAATSMKR